MNIKPISDVTFKPAQVTFRGEKKKRKTTFQPIKKESLTYSSQEKRILKQGFFYSLVMLSAAIAYFSILKK